MFLFELKRDLKGYIVLEDKIHSLWQEYVKGKKSFNYDNWIRDGKLVRGIYNTQALILESLGIERMHDVEGHDETAYYFKVFLGLLEKVDK